MENIIEIKNLNYSYDKEVLALKNINMNIPKGKLTAIIGPNGAGKSTLFLNLNGVLKADAGEILVEGKKLDYSRANLLEMRKNVGIVFQDPDDQLFSADVYKDISFGPINLGYPKEVVKEKVEDAMEKTGVTHLAKRPTHALSYGQKKRVAIAGVVAMEPKVIILDEPTAGLDPKGVEEIMTLLKKLKDEKGITIILSTHELDIVSEYADYIYIINSGEIKGSGAPSEIFYDIKLIKENNLRLPILVDLATQLQLENIKINNILKMQDMKEELKKLIKNKS